MLFKLGLFLIPFENLLLAPSAGWAAVAPIIFFIYILKNIKFTFRVIEKKEIYIFLMLVILTLINFLRYSLIISNVANNLITLILGYSFYLSLKIRYLVKKKEIVKDIDYLFIGYFISLIIGILQFVIYRFKIIIFIDLFRVLSKRFYYPRVQLTYAEPSFIPIHLFGIMLIFLIFCMRNKIKLKKSIYLLFFLSIIITNLIVLSTRLVLDTLVVFGIVLFCYILKSKKKVIKILLLVSLPICFIVTKYIAESNVRLNRVLEEGVYADSSLASRWFRINASLEGYKQAPLTVLIGYGIGNLYIPFQLGYEEARENYKNHYLNEVIALKESKPKSLFSMPIKIISEFGIIVFSIILFSIFSYKYLDIYFILLYLYLQFDSYALYTVWIYIFLKTNFEKLIFEKETKK